MNEQIDFISKEIPVTENISHEVALDILTVVLYRMYLESVVNHGHTDHAA